MGEISLKWLGQAGFLITLQDGKRICVDPYLSNAAEDNGACVRMWQSELKASALQPDLLICTHDHLDHLDPETIVEISKCSTAVFAGPPSCVEHFKKLGVDESHIRTLSENGEMSFGGAVISAIHATHTDDSIGVIINSSGISICITGDTSLSDRLLDSLRGHSVDLLICCINGMWGNLNADEAAELAVITGCKAAIPMHYGLFADNTEDPSAFVNSCLQKNYSGSAYVLTAFDRYCYNPIEGLTKI